MAEIKERYNFKYGGRKFTIVYNPASANINGVRFDIQNITSIVINNNLSSRQKQLLIHRLITGRRLRGFHNKSKVRMFII
ncbi:hypothetical protein psyc5s11_53840 [Clostridium gelidum]|uniref:Uncharacterized protein n=1 Tax=Clostridium gelidum TaxID=704125 RepID=A0ABM7TBL0_9CLOT|nr:hypothetical protein [Clostridium gelidum]BCZ49317.1 hypothetical protein psyc5s11_53840 [Clostridium gelidum]